MAENSKITSLELNGVKYGLGKSIYAELGMSLERFVELLGRDLYCPTLESAPTSSTTSYADTDGSICNFQVGQPCRWQEDGVWRLAVCVNSSGSVSAWYILPTKVSELMNDAGYLTHHQDISGLLDKITADSTYATKTENDAKQDKNLKFANVQASSWVSSTTYADYSYQCDLSCNGVTSFMYAEVVFAPLQATSGNYAPVCETFTDVVRIYSKVNASITIPTVLIEK